MKQSSGGYNGDGSNGAWLPSQNWQELAKKRQEKVAVAEAEKSHREKLLKRRIALTFFVVGTIGIVAPASIYSRFAHAEDIDASMGYTLAQEARITFGGRLDDADPVVSDGEAFLTDGTTEDQTATDAQDGQADPAVTDDTQPQAAEPIQESGQSTNSTTEEASADVQTQSDVFGQESQVAVETYAGEPVATEAASQPVTPQVAPQEPNAVVTTSYDSATAAAAEVPATAEPSWWSVPSWSTSSAPQYEAIGIWDTHYYIAHNWTSYGKTILALQNGDTLSIDGQRLMVTDSDYFSAGTDYETVRARFGWDTWCMQTCYGDSQVRIVAFVPIA